MNRIRKEQHRTARLIEPYAGKWVTLSADKKRVLGVSTRMETALAQAKDKGEKHPHLIKAPDATTAAYIF